MSSITQDMQFEIVMGLEVHAELDTASKIYCGCTTQFGGAENTHCCPVCTAMPGVMPALNERVVEYCVRAGIALNCEINRYSRQDRKHYYYPDLPKAFQTSQFDLPLCLDGYVDIDVDGQKKRIGITRIHIEEDAGKLLHEGRTTRVDLNRCGVPLIEIVSEPDFRSAEEVRAYLEELRAILLYTGVSNCRMQEGSLRCDINLSARPVGQKEFGTRTEMKNLNSFSAAYRAVQYETKRQIRVLKEGGIITQDTLRWDDARGVNYAMRTKEDADEYFYFPEPDIMPIVLSEEYIQAVRESVPELPAQRRSRYVLLGLSEYDARLMTSSRKLSDLFDDCVENGANPKQTANYILSDCNRLLNERNMEAEDLPIEAGQLSSLMALVQKGTISRSIASKVMEMMFDQPKMPEELVREHGMAQVNDESAIQEMCMQAIANSPKAVEDYHAGKKKALTSLVGQVMKASKGKANPGMVNQLLIELLEKSN